MQKPPLPFLALLLPALCVRAEPPDPPTEQEVYPMITLPTPPGEVLEVGGMDWLDPAKKRLAVCTRRGEIWVVDNPYATEPTLDGEDPAQRLTFTRMHFGLHEPLGMMVNPPGFPEGIYMAQRSELTRARDLDGDDRIDELLAFNQDWEISGSYHEYAFGPKLHRDGRLWVTLNRPFGGGQEPGAYWRGWCVAIDADGEMVPICPGLRSPAGLGTNPEGEMFYTDNQGDHVAACKLSHLKPGSFQGNPVGLDTVDHPRSTFELPFKDYPKRDIYWGEAMAANPRLQAPAVWFPYPVMGKSHTDIWWDSTEGKFGPFSKQLFVGDLSTAAIYRVFLEKVGGEYQGACFPFRKGFRSGALRFCWGHDGSLFVGGTNRGWGGGPRPFCLQRLVWSGITPFEIHEMRAGKDGFTLRFTQPVDRESAARTDTWACQSWTYKYYSRYGDDQHLTEDLTVTSATVAPDGRSVRLVIDGLRPWFVHALEAKALRSEAGHPLLHPTAYYTLNRIPE